MWLKNVLTCCTLFSDYMKEVWAKITASVTFKTFICMFVCVRLNKDCEDNEGQLLCHLIQLSFTNSFRWVVDPIYY